MRKEYKFKKTDEINVIMTPQTALIEVREFYSTKQTQQFALIRGVLLPPLFDFETILKTNKN